MAAAAVTVVEVEPFPQKADLVWTEEERMEFVTFIAHYPEAGDRIAGSGGLRKVRWTRRGRGKRGGVRVIYYFHDQSMPLFLLTVYPKSRKDELTPEEMKAMRKLVAQLRSSYAKPQITQAESP